MKRSSEAAGAYRDLRRHPVSNLLRAAADGHLPSEAELDALGLSPVNRRKVGDEAQIVAAIRAGGSNQDARDRAGESAEQIVGSLPKEQRSAEYLKPPEPDITDPAELAAQISRGY